MKYILGMLFGYVIHDAVQQTSIGEVLDKVSLPSDLFVSKEEDNSNESSV